MKAIKFLYYRLFEVFSSVRTLISKYEIATYAVEEINMKTHLVVVKCVGSRTIVKLALESLITDNVIISGLSSSQACMVGGYYGRLLRASLEGREAFKKIKNMNFFLKSTNSRYEILFENRNGEIGYFDKKTKKDFVEHPLVIAKHDYIISRFDPSQACYIGILAGIYTEKTIKIGHQSKSKLDFVSTSRKRPTLRIVE